MTGWPIGATGRKEMAMTYLEILGWDRKGVIAVLPFFFIWGVRGRWPRHPAQGRGVRA